MIQRVCDLPRNLNQTANLTKSGLVQESRNGIVEACNLQALCILRKSKKEIIGKKAVELWKGAIDFDGSPITLKEDKKQIIGLPQKEGEIIWLEIEVQGLYGFDGEEKINTTYSFRIIHQEQQRRSRVWEEIDLTSRQEAQEALKQSENKFSRLVEANFFGVAIGDYSGKILYANDALLDMIGYSQEELEAGEIYWFNLTPPEYLPLDYAAGEELLKNGISTPFEKEYIHKDGHRVPILIGSALLNQSNKTEEQIITFYMDLTELKQAQIATLEQQILLETILEQAENAVIVCDREGKITLVNSTARRLARNYLPDMTDLNALDWGVGLSPEDDVIPLQKYVLYKALQGQISKAMEARMIYPDGYY